MIINNFYVVGIAIPELKADTPLTINTNTILTLPIASQFLKPISRWYTQIR